MYKKEMGQKPKTGGSKIPVKAGRKSDFDPNLSLSLSQLIIHVLTFICS